MQTGGTQAKLLRFSLALLLSLITLLPIVVSAADPQVTIEVTPVVAPVVTSFPATEITHTTAKLNGAITKTGNDNPHTRGFVWGYTTGNYTVSWNETGSYGIGDFHHTATNLTVGVEVFWKAFVINTNSIAYSAERSFFTLLLPNAPTNLAVTVLGTDYEYLGGNSSDTTYCVNLSWTMGLYSTSTYIRYSTAGYPTTPTGGNLAYNGTGNWTVICGLALDTTTYYISAWGENLYGFSTSYATISTEGGNMLLTMILGILALGLTVSMFATKNSMLGFPSGIFWAIFGGANYIASTATWDIYYLMFFAGMGMFIFTIFAAFGLRKRDLAGPDADKGAFIDEDGRRPKTPDIIEVPRRQKAWGDIDGLGMYDTEDTGYVSPHSEAIHNRLNAKAEARKERANSRRAARGMGL